MKPILLIRTGGTIGSVFDGNQRTLGSEASKAALFSSAQIKEDLFCESHFPEACRTLSENMTPGKLSAIATHLLSFDLARFSGAMILHGTDTLAYSASLFSFLFPNPPCPILFISGNRPPEDPGSNAGDNFRFGVGALLGGLDKAVFVPYRNEDGTMTLHRGCRLIQCPDFSQDFSSVSGDMPPRSKKRFPLYQGQALASDQVLLISPYPGLSYERIGLSGIRAVVHGTYHSGTLCAQGEAPYGFCAFQARCRKEGVPLFLAPAVIKRGSYESMVSLDPGGITCLSMTTESAYAKAIAGLTLGLLGPGLTDYMESNIAGEIIKNSD